MPEKNFLAFLEMLGLKLLPPLPARAPLSFALATGTKEQVLIPARTQATAGEVVFETERGITATPAHVSAAYALDAKNDRIVECPSGIFSQTQEKVTSFELFEGRNVQEHALYLGHEEFFHMKPNPESPSTIGLGVTLLEGAQQPLALEWSYYGREKDTKQAGWIAIDARRITDNTSGLTKTGEIRLTLTGEIEETEVHGIKSRWIRSALRGPLARDTKRPVVDTLVIRTQNTVHPERAFYNDVPLDLTLDKAKQGFKTPLYPLGKRPRTLDTFYLGCSEAFSKKGAGVTVRFSIIYAHDVPVLRIHGVGPKFAEKLNAAGIRTAADLMKFTPERLAALLKTKQIKTAQNILEAAKKAFYDKTHEEEKREARLTRVSGEELTLSWEYWNGKGWVALQDLETDKTDGFPETITFICPPDLAITSVNGQEDYWIRVRIISGDFGKERYVEKNGAWSVDISQINPPVLGTITITYDNTHAPQTLHHCIAFNNLDFVDVSEESRSKNKPFEPFQPLEDDHQTFYLGFDLRLEKGPISIFFALEEQEYLEENPPLVEWEYPAEIQGTTKWTRLDVRDETRNLTQTGTLECIFPLDCAKTRKFGKELYWIRAVDTGDTFTPLSKTYAGLADRIEIDKLHPFILRDYLLPGLKKYRPELYPAWRDGYLRVSSGEAPLVPPKSFSKEGLTSSDVNSLDAVDPAGEREPCTKRLRIFHRVWSHPPEIRWYSPAPRIRGIYLNTTWGIQAETIRNEILGSSEGTENQTFSVTRIPVLDEELWLNELSALSEGEMEGILERGELTAKPVRDEKGDFTQFWIRWQAVDDLIGSSGADRHYEIDRTTGEIRFGDGVNGKIPPRGRDNIKVDYRPGGGKKGNVGALEIKTLKTGIAFVDTVSNPLPAGGGSEAEIVNRALERGSQLLRLRDRAVTREDFEWLALQASREIARAKCLPHVDNRGEPSPGWVTVLIVPESDEDLPVLSLQLKKRVLDYLREHAATVVVDPEHLQVTEPRKVSVAVDATLIATSPDAVPGVEKAAYTTLKAFLHPLTGGYEG
ncbi:MAG: putative baseplate assembly protein, partial [Methanophagales archaeon ANME-1-THS]